MKTKILSLFAVIIFLGCSSDDDISKANNPENYVGNQYAHLLFATSEECIAAQEYYFTNCAQTLEVINSSEVEIVLSDIIYRTRFYLTKDEFIVKSSQDTYEFSEDLIFKIMENGDLKLEEQFWRRFEEDIYESDFGNP